MRLGVLAGAVVATSLLGAGVAGVALLGPDAGSRQADAPPAGARSAPNATGLAFVENRGQVDRRARFYLQGPGASVFFTPKGLAMSLVAGRRAGDRWSL